MKLKVLAAIVLCASMSIATNIPFAGISVARAQNSHQCMQIQNPDRRNLCVAKMDKNASVCGMIRDQDMRNLCMAQVQKNRSICGMIKDLDMRAECNANM